MLPENNGGEKVEDWKIEEVFSQIMEKASNGFELDFESSNFVQRTRKVVPGLGPRLAFLATRTISGITDAEMAKLVIQWTLDRIAAKRRGETGKPKSS